MTRRGPLGGSPDIRLARVRDLARWNDRTERRLPEVLALLEEAVTVAGRERARLLAEPARTATREPGHRPERVLVAAGR